MKTLAKALGSQSFSITAEMSLLGYAPAGEILQQAKELSPLVDGVQVAESPQQQGQMSPVALAALLLDEGIDPVTRLNCRDRNRLALQSDLVGLKALGVSSLVLNHGNSRLKSGTPTGKPVFDINCRDLISLAAEISEEQISGTCGEFMIGTSATVFAPKPDWKAARLNTWSKAGTRFLQTRPCFDIPLLRRYMQRLVNLRLTWNYAVVVTLGPLPGREIARWQIENSGGTIVPNTVMRELAAAADPVQAGIEICARQMREIAKIPGVSGINLLTLGDPGAAAAAIESSGLRDQN